MQTTPFNSVSNQISYWLDHNLSVYWRARYGLVNRWLDPALDDIMLEIGCGRGRWSRYFAPSVHKTHAIDIDKRALDRLSRESQDVVLSCASAEALPYEGEVFSKALAIDVIEHVPNDLLMLEEVGRVLRVGGMFILTTLLQNRPHYLRRMKFDDHLREYEPETLIKLILGAGFKVLEVKYFYYAPRMLAREIQSFAVQLPLGNSMVTKSLSVSVKIAVGVLCRLIGDVERIMPIGRPGGISIVSMR